MKAEDKYFEGGKLYVPRPQKGCTGCAFDNRGPCPDGQSKVACAAADRKDKTSVVWVETSALRHFVAEAVK